MVFSPLPHINTTRLVHSAPWSPCTDTTFRLLLPYSSQYLDGHEVDCDLVFDNGQPVYGAITDNWPTVEPYFNETGSNCPSILPKAQQVELMLLSIKSVQVRASQSSVCEAGRKGGRRVAG